MTATSATPEQRRAAWLTLMLRLEVEAGAVHSRAVYAREQARLRMDSADTEMSRESYARQMAREDAEMWAAKKILDALKVIPAPEIPVDHTKNQTTIEEAITPDA